MEEEEEDTVDSDSSDELKDEGEACGHRSCYKELNSCILKCQITTFLASLN